MRLSILIHLVTNQEHKSALRLINSGHGRGSAQRQLRQGAEP
jgi:hypothetical protein